MVEEQPPYEVPAELRHLFGEGGLAAAEKARREHAARCLEPGQFERYCESVLTAFLAAKGLRLVPRARRSGRSE
jgi:hypothetical protein